MAREKSFRMILQFSKYGFISGISLICDLCFFKLLTDFNEFSIPIAATISYCSGLAFSYTVLILTLFKQAKYSNRRLIEMLLFALSGIMGSATTFIVSSVVSNYRESSAWEAKFFAVGMSFLVVYFFRINFVFPKKES